MIRVQIDSLEKHFPIIFGIGVTVCLIFVLVITRVSFDYKHTPVLELSEVKAMVLSEPPPLPNRSNQQKKSNSLKPLRPLPPLPVVAPLSALGKVKPHIEIPLLSALSTPPALEVETFFVDEPPAIISPDVDLILLPKKENKKTHYVLGELDGKPRLIFHPKVTFPPSMRNLKEIRMVIRVEIFPSGKSEFLTILSITHDDLIAIAATIGNGSLFTPPLSNGKTVRAILTWPITIKNK